MSQLVTNDIAGLITSQMPAIALVMNGTSEQDRKSKAERFARICLTAVRKNQKLIKCTQESFAAALMTCAQLNLEPNTPQGLAYLIPYGNECQFQIGYKGLLQLVYRSGIIASFNADVVYRAEVENGLFEYRKGITPTITHKVDLLHPEDREGELIAAYAACTLKGGGEGLLRLVDRKDIERAQKTSASLAAYKMYGKDSPWISSPEAMWMKTAIKRLVSWLPQTEMLAMAVDLDDKAERGEPQLSLPELTPTAGLNAALTEGGKRARPTNAEMETRRKEAADAWLATGNPIEDVEKLINAYARNWNTAQCEKVRQLAAEAMRSGARQERQEGTPAASERPETQPAPAANLITCPKTETQVSDWTCSDCEQRPECPAWAE